MKKSEIQEIENTRLKQVWNRIDEIQEYHNSKIVCKGVYYLNNGKEYFIPTKYAKVDMTDSKVVNYLILKQSKGVSLTDSLEMLISVKTEDFIDKDWGRDVNKKLTKVKLLENGATRTVSYEKILKMHEEGIKIRNIYFKNGSNTPIIGYSSLHIKEYSSLLAEARILEKEIGY